MSNICNNILDTIGHTPLVRINKLNDGKAEILAKVEFFNPGGSAKDRVGLSLLEAAEKSGQLRPGGTLIEPTSGNTGVGLALAAAIKGYKVILTMPDTMSLERRRLIAAYGAEIVLTPGQGGMAAAVAKANELHQAIPNSIIPQQFENPANTQAHKATTGPEIWEQTDGQIDAFVAGVGTGGTITGVAEYLKAKNPNIRIIAVEPASSPLLSKGQAGPHALQGIGANFVPAILKRELLDRIITVSNEDAGRLTVEAARQEGLLVGITSGAALFAAIQLSKAPEYQNKRIVVLLPDTGTRYLSGWPFA